MYAYKDTGGKNQPSTSTLSRPKTVLEMEQHPDEGDFGYCFRYRSWTERPGVPRCLRVCAPSTYWSTPPLIPFGPTTSSFLYSPFQDFTSSQSWSVESSTSDSPTSIAIINEMSESLLPAGSCSPAMIIAKSMVSTELRCFCE